MEMERNLEGGNERDNGPLDAFLKGERISTDALIMLTLQQQFAKTAREQNELEDFDDDGCIGDCSEEKSEARLRRQRETDDILGRFNTVAANFDEPVWAEVLAPAATLNLKPVWTAG